MYEDIIKIASYFVLFQPKSEYADWF